MGSLTRGQIVTEGLLLAGNANLTTRANQWLNSWLRSHYRSWPWPFLIRRAQNITLSAGATSLLVGGGNNGITEQVQRLYDPVYVYTADKKSRAIARIRSVIAGPVDMDESVLDPADNRGMPQYFKVRSNTVWGTWQLEPYPYADQTYSLAFDYLIQPADITSDATVPVYPNDQTMIQAVVAWASRYMKLESAGGELELLSAMGSDDRLKYGEVPGINDQLKLDGASFVTPPRI
jgi:hypothetical protein